MNQVIPLEFARYVLLHPEKDPEWREHARKLMDWVKTTPEMAQVHGAWRTHYERSKGTARTSAAIFPTSVATVTARGWRQSRRYIIPKTGDIAYKEQAYRTYNWVTYLQGLPRDAHAPFSDQWWFTDEYSDGPRRMMDAFWAVPEWAPAEESHLLGSLSVVTPDRL